MTKKSVWLHLVDKPTVEDLQYEAEIYNDKLNIQPMSSRAEIWSWYMVDFGTTPVFIVLVGMIFPVYVTILATQYGCEYNTPYGCDYDNNPINSNEPVMVYIGNIGFKPESFATLMIALSGILQCIAYLFISSIADYSNYQHHLYRICMVIGCSMIIICIIFNEPKHYEIFGICSALMLVPLGLAQILYNAYLPVLVGNHWSIRRLDRTDDMRQSNQSFIKQYKNLLKSIQDDMSQFGICVGYIGGLIATIVSAVILFIFIDNTTQIISDFGINSSNQHVIIMEDKEEYWMKKVIGIHVWYSYIDILDNTGNIIIDNESFINGMQFVYNDIDINGSIHGVNDLSQFDIDNGQNDGYNVSIQFMDRYLNIDDNDYINELVLFQSNQTQIIQSISMITYNSNQFDIGRSNDDHLLSEIVIKSDNYPKDTLCGYATSTAIYDISSIISLPIISGYSFIFMDNEQGQYGNNYDNLGVYTFVGIWCLIFSIPSFCILEKRKKPPLPKTSSICTISVKSYWHSMKTATSFPNLFRTLIAWFIWSDAQNTIGTIGILFAQNELNMNGIQLIVMLLEIQLLASIGNIISIWLQNQCNLTSKNLLVIHLCINCMLPIWAMFGLIESSPIGLVNIWEIYVIVGLFYASQLGSLWSSSRSLYGHFIPIGYESKYFGLYELTNKGSSWIGPLIAAFIANAYSLRYGFIYVLVFYLIAIPILQFGVNYDDGLKQAGKLDFDEINNMQHNINDTDLSDIDTDKTLNGEFESTEMEPICIADDHDKHKNDMI